VYRFRDARGRVLYVGRATELRGRVGSYWSDLRDRPHLVSMVNAVARIEAVVCDSPHEAGWLERNLLEQTLPRWNRTPGGQESPVHLRLDTRPGSAGLRVVHLPEPEHGVLHFGPYLGGQRARLAVTALHRVLPLAYTGSGLSPAEREMARERGVGADDRERLGADLEAVLRRDAAALDAVRTRLAGVRDRAAAALAFELAGRIQEELAALDWLTGPQRVASTLARDFDVYGWSEGILVHFAVRSGYLRGWSQRRCGSAGAQPRLTATPPDWADFARRNAELAAALAPAP
jgi:excinuclease ABC subunit C